MASAQRPDGREHGGAADGSDCNRYNTAGSNEYGNRYRTVSPETGLEAVPRLPIAKYITNYSRIQ